MRCSGGDHAQGALVAECFWCYLYVATGNGSLATTDAGAFWIRSWDRPYPDDPVMPRFTEKDASFLSSLGIALNAEADVVAS